MRTVELPIPTRVELSTALNRYREFLKMEYPRYYWNPNYEPWLPGDLEHPRAREQMPRAIAKAIYGSEYYQNREITQALDAFAAGVLRERADPARGGRVLAGRERRQRDRRRDRPTPLVDQARARGRGWSVWACLPRRRRTPSSSR